MCVPGLGCLGAGGIRWIGAARLSRMRSSGLHHLDLVVSSLERSLPFYRGLLEPLGWTDIEEVEGERGETIWYISGPGTLLGLREKQSDSNPIPYDRYGVGVHHVCFEVESRADVDERADWLRDQGAEIESVPQEYGYVPGYYAVFFYDPDGLKLELVYVPERA
jgi:glyoxylase I family protein